MGLGDDPILILKHIIVPKKAEGRKNQARQDLHQRSRRCVKAAKCSAEHHCPLCCATSHSCFHTVYNFISSSRPARSAGLPSMSTAANMVIRRWAHHLATQPWSDDKPFALDRVTWLTRLQSININKVRQQHYIDMSSRHAFVWAGWASNNGSLPRGPTYWNWSRMVHNTARSTSSPANFTRSIGELICP